MTAYKDSTHGLCQYTVPINAPANASNMDSLQNAWNENELCIA